MDFKSRIIAIHNLINQNKLSEALIKCQNLSKKFPNNSYLLNLQGLILQNSGQIKTSILYFQKAIFFQKDNYAAKNNLANAHKSLFEFKEAEILYKEIIRDDLRNIKALNEIIHRKFGIVANTYEVKIIQSIVVRYSNFGISLSITKL